MLGTELIAVRLALQPRPLGRLLQPFPQHRTWRQAGQALGDMDRLADAFRTNREDGDISPARLRCDVHCLCRRAFIRPGNQRSLLDRRGRPSTGNVQEAAMPATIQMILPARIPMIGKLQNNELGVGRHHHRRHQGRDATQAAKDRVSNAESVTTLISPFSVAAVRIRRSAPSRAHPSTRAAPRGATAAPGPLIHLRGYVANLSCVRKA